MRLVTVGTTPIQILDPSERRTRLEISMQPLDVDANNTGRVHIGFGHVPVATVGHSAQGEVLIQGSGIFEPSTELPLSRKHKRGVWAIASAASQSILVEEDTEE